MKKIIKDILYIIAAILAMIFFVLLSSCKPVYKVVNKQTGFTVTVKGYLGNEPDTSIWSVRKLRIYERERYNRTQSKRIKSSYN